MLGSLAFHKRGDLIFNLSKFFEGIELKVFYDPGQNLIALLLSLLIVHKKLHTLHKGNLVLTVKFYLLHHGEKHVKLQQDVLFLR